MSASSSQRILYLWDADYPWDVRTEKVCRALTDAGHQVDIVARNKRWNAPDESLPEGTVRRMSPWRWAGRAMDQQLSFPFFANPRWASLLARTMRDRKPSLIIVRDLPLAPLAVWMGRRAGVPVILDMAENYPAMIRDVWDAGRAGPLDVLVRNPSIIAAVERYVLPRLDHVITVVEESSERIVPLGVPSGRASVVSNTPSAKRIAPVRPQSTDGVLRLVYLGLMEVPRGVLEVLDAVAALVSEGRRVDLQLVGGGRDLGLFRERAAALGLQSPTVTFHGTLPHAEALAVVARSEIGLVPHHASESWNTTIPNKLFDYMAAGLPVVSSDARPAQRVVESTGAGLVYPSRDAAALADRLRRLTDPSLRASMAAAGQSAIRARYNWEEDTRTLLDVVGSVTSAR